MLKLLNSICSRLIMSVDLGTYFVFRDVHSGNSHQTNELVYLLGIVNDRSYRSLYTARSQLLELA